MNPIRTTAIVAACLLAAISIGMWASCTFHTDQLGPETRETVKLGTGLIATIAALLLGLLVNSSKTYFNTTRTQLSEVASKYSFLSRLLEIYGPQADGVRSALHALIEETMRRLWPDDAHTPAPSVHKNQIGNAFYSALLNLETCDDTERTLKAQAVSLVADLGQLRSLMEAESTTSTSKPMLVVLVFWLVMIFLGYSLIVPANATDAVILIVSAWCATGSIFLILEQDDPFRGIIRISSKPLLDVLEQFEK
jgi:hypothetical protein